MFRRKVEREVLLVLVLAAWCCFTLAKSVDGSGAARRNGGVNGGAAGAEDSPLQPHIVFIFSDDLGWNDIPWHNEEVVAPNLESLAREGVILEQSYVQPLCTPSRSALMSGRYPFTIGRQHYVIRAEEPVGLDRNLTIMPQFFKAVGYDTHIVGKWHLGFCSWDYTPTERGFDTFYGYYLSDEDFYEHTKTCVFDDQRQRPHHINTTSCNDLDCGNLLDERDSEGYLDFRDNKEIVRNLSGVYSTYIFASYVEKLLTTRDSQVPMFLYIPLQSVHFPLEVPAQYEEPYAYIEDQDRRTYLGMVTAMDEAVGRVVDALKMTGHYNNSVIVFSSDNGGTTEYAASNWPLRGEKDTLWEGGTRGAAFVHSPLLPNPGTVNNKLMHVTDWLPTLVGLAGGEAPEGIDGVDQWAALTGEAPSARSELVYNIDNTTRFVAGIRMGNYKLLVGDPGFTEGSTNIQGADDDGGGGGGGGGEEKMVRDDIMTVSDFVGEAGRLLKQLTGSDDTEVSLYDLESDPEETDNVAATHEEEVAVMADLIAAHMTRYIPADVPERIPEAHPNNFDGVWSPGWC